MKHTILFSLLIFCFCFSSFAQQKKYEALPITKEKATFWGSTYIYNGEKMGLTKLSPILKLDPQAKKQIRNSNILLISAIPVVLLGGAMMDAASEEIGVFRWDFFLGGMAVDLLGFAMAGQAGRIRVKSVDTYNTNMGFTQAPAPKVKLGLTVGQNGLGIGLKF